MQAHDLDADRLSVRARRFRKLRWRRNSIRRRANGGVFLGLNGIVIKSHGGADANGFSAAVDIGYDMVRHELMAKIGQALVPESAWWWKSSHRHRATGGRSGIVTLRSVIVGAGCYLPERVLTNAELAHQGRYLRRMDRAAHRHPRTPYRGRRRIHLPSRHQGGAGGACRCRHDAAGHRSDRVRDLDARTTRSRRPRSRSSPGLASPAASPSICRRSVRASSTGLRPWTDCCAAAWPSARC